MENNKLSLRKLVDQEHAENVRKYGHGHSSTNFDLTMTKEERDWTEQLTRIRNRIDSAIDISINSAVTHSLNHARILVYPQVMARHGVFGTNVVMNIIHGAKPGDEDLVEEIIDEFNAFQSRFNYKYSAHNAIDAQQHARFLKNNYSERTRNLAECFWLLKLCDWFDCTLPTFKNCVDEILKNKSIMPITHVPSMADFTFSQVHSVISKNGDASPPPPTIEFSLFFESNPVLQDRGIVNKLQAESVMQYRALESLLGRL